MANGTREDHPLTDILIHGRPVFSDQADALIRDIRRFASLDEMYNLVDWFSLIALIRVIRLLWV